MKNLRIPLLLLATVVLASCGAPQRMIRFSPMLVDSLKATHVNLADYEKKYAKYDGVFLLAEESMEHVANKDLSYWHFYRMKTLRYLVLDPDAEWLSTFNLGLDSGSTLLSAKVHIMNPDGSTRSYGMEDLKKTESADGSTRYKLAYADIRKGSIVQESYETALDPLSSEALRPSVNVQYAVPTERVIFQYAIPDSWETVFKKIAPGKSLPMNTRIYRMDDKSILSYDAKDVPAMADEPYAPYFKEVSNYIEFMLTELGPTMKSPNRWGWADFGTTFSTLREDRSWSSSRMKEMVDTIVRGKTSDIDKLNAITKFVQKNITIEHSDRRNQADWTLVTGKGDPVQVCALTRGLLRDIGINSRVVLVHSARDGYFDSTFLSLDQFAMPVVEAIINDTSYIAFPYWKNYPTNVLPDHIQGQRGLVILDEHASSFLVTLPYGDTVANVLDDSYNLAIDDDGTISVEEVRSLHGTNAFWERERLAAMDEDETSKEIRDFLTYSDGDIKVKDFEILNKDDYEQPLIIKTRYSIDNLVTVTPEEVIFQTGGLLSPSTARKRKLDTTERQNPIRIYQNEELTKKITITHPASWKLVTALENTEQSNEFGTISGKYSSGEGTLTVEHHRVLKRTSAPKEKSNELLEVTGRKSRLNVPTLVFKVNR